MSFEYALPANHNMIGQEIPISNFSDLNIKYMSYENNLCASIYDRGTMCIWEGDLKVTLLVNDKLITLNDHDKRKGINHRVGRYTFQGIDSEVEDMRKDKTYLIFKISQ